jgi:hypothetical protein
VTDTVERAGSTRRWLGLAAFSMPVLVLSIDMNDVVAIDLFAHKDVPLVEARRMFRVVPK